MATEQPQGFKSEPNALPVKAQPLPYAELFADIQTEWDKAESSIKRSEQVALDVSIPAITELRYGGRRIVDALNATASGEPEADVRAFLEDARFCCHRARHDAVDAAFSKIAIDLDDLTKRLGFEAMIAAYPEFREFYADFTRARAKIADSRERRGDRAAIYEAIDTVDLPDLVKRYEQIVACTPIAKEFAAKARVKAFGFWVMLFLAVLGAFFSGKSYERNLKADSAKTVSLR
jgi:hypothetical protein